ncbi:hypothetical protein RIF29_08200 [Crotalaria pallida]|uniref:Uncharacterized protein n=1 Tax=Crotalaria pallida TaxID=3830 RepID=A0AAN9J692_CROPI
MTCPKYRVTFDASVIWGLIGPKRLFGRGGLYRNMAWLFLIGAVLPVPVWVLSKIFPDKKWIALINIPVISYGFAGMPPATTPTNIASWLITGMIFNYFVSATIVAEIQLCPICSAGCRHSFYGCAHFLCTAKCWA